MKPCVAALLTNYSASQGDFFAIKNTWAIAQSCLDAPWTLQVAMIPNALAPSPRHEQRSLWKGRIPA